MSAPLIRTIRHGGQSRAISADASAPLIEVVRAEIQARSVIKGCHTGTCGSCRMLVNGEIVTSCTTLWGELPESFVLELYEDISSDLASVSAVHAFDKERPTRCRMCVGALGLTAVALSRKGLSHSEEAVDKTLETAACMCTGRGSWRRALLPNAK